MSRREVRATLTHILFMCLLVSKPILGVFALRDRGLGFFLLNALTSLIGILNIELTVKDYPL
ncbi:hypothetical protein [Nostoc sp.]|uniref:hypothetical protein n=1 Tax=Nostoc sp. TaxID=1180 RepID=UPI002FFD57C9